MYVKFNYLNSRDLSNQLILVWRKPFHRLRLDVLNVDLIILPFFFRQAQILVSKIIFYAGNILLNDFFPHVSERWGLSFSLQAFEVVAVIQGKFKEAVRDLIGTVIANLTDHPLSRQTFEGWIIFIYPLVAVRLFGRGNTNDIAT